MQPEVRTGLFQLDFAGAIKDLVGIGNEYARAHESEIKALIGGSSPNVFAGTRPTS